MDINKYAIGIIIVVILLIILSSAIPYHKHVCHKSFLKGFWQAPITFCKNSDIGSACAYITEDTIYMIMIDNSNNVMINNYVPYTLSYVHNVKSWNPLNNTYMEYEIEVTDLDPLPSSMKLRIDMYNGILMFYTEDDETDKSTIYLQLLKNNNATTGIL